ncbi:hypothetical protein BGZ76_003751 [Entomortierella beljakovae]|nr:hypothetical protein BGZ76_003751 [Entomortierella beljakovae]
MNQPQEKGRPEVIIIGAGIAGLMMALLLEQIGTQYHIFERASEVKPLGSAMVLSSHNVAALSQLGIYEELMQIARPLGNVCFYQGDCKPIGFLSREHIQEKFGYHDVAFSRPDFYEILRKRIPADKISFKKKVLDIKEEKEKVTIRCSDDTTYTGDILIGADGAYSAVRQAMYKQMGDKGIRLPKEDLEDFNIGYTVVVGVAKGDLEKQPFLEETRKKFCQLLFDGNSNCYIVTLPNNQISWGFGTQLSREEMKALRSGNSGWNEESSESTIQPYRDYPSPTGGTMGDIFDATPKELTSKVYLEEKIFKTWHHGRIVLIGDAVHKLHPAGGQGASNALHDAVVLANCLYALKENNEQAIHEAFSDYYDQRYIYAEYAYQMSADMSIILNGQKFWQKVLRKVALNYIPIWMLDYFSLKISSHRPQIAWLPLVKNHGRVKINPQRFEEKTNAASL